MLQDESPNVTRYLVLAKTANLPKEHGQYKVLIFCYVRQIRYSVMRIIYVRWLILYIRQALNTLQSYRGILEEGYKFDKCDTGTVCLEFSKLLQDSLFWILCFLFAHLKIESRPNRGKPMRTRGTEKYATLLNFQHRTFAYYMEMLSRDRDISYVPPLYRDHLPVSSNSGLLLAGSSITFSTSISKHRWQKSVYKMPWRI